MIDISPCQSTQNIEKITSAKLNPPENFLVKVVKYVRKQINTNFNSFVQARCNC